MGAAACWERAIQLGFKQASEKFPGGAVFKISASVSEDWLNFQHFNKTCQEVKNPSIFLIFCVCNSKEQFHALRMGEVRGKLFKYFEELPISVDLNFHHPVLEQQTLFEDDLPENIFSANIRCALWT